MVLAFFGGDKDKAHLWFMSKNPMLGGISPDQMIDAGRYDRLLRFIQQSLADNERPAGDPR